MLVFEPMAALAGDNEDYILNYDKLLEINEALVKQYLDIIFMYRLGESLDELAQEINGVEPYPSTNVDTYFHELFLEL